MAIVEMSKIRLYGLSYHRDAILNALQHTGSVEIYSAEKSDETAKLSLPQEKNVYTSKYAELKKAIDFLTDCIEKSSDKKYFDKNSVKFINNFVVSYDEFINIAKSESDILEIADRLNEDLSQLTDKKSETIKAENLILQLTPYSELKENFSDYRDTKYTKVFLGLIKHENLQQIIDYVLCSDFTDISVISDSPVSLISVVSMEKEAAETLEKLNEAGFTACPFTFDCTAAEKIAECEQIIAKLKAESDEIVKDAYGLYGKLKDLKILADYYKFQLEKIDESENFSCTATTFELKGYVPKDKREETERAIYNVSDAVFIEFSEPDKDDDPPTLTKNNKIVQQTEFITDMYSAPNYRELDPNKIIFWFYMVFMGLIMADIGYGIVMMLVGFGLSFRIKVQNGTKKLWNIIGIGGVFTVIFGILFNSLFGVSILPFSILPNPNISAGGTTEAIYLVLLGCLGLGVVQIAVGYLLKAVNAFRRKEYLDGIFDGIVWFLFFIGFILAATRFLIRFLSPSTVLAPWLNDFLSVVETPALYFTIFCVALAALTAGRHEKGFGKFSKTFGALYGLINIMSDILSYARLFGLMLSGMIIATTFNNLGLQLMNGGAAGLVLGPIVIVIGHVFNIAMGVLGAYIHDSRLQYIEFFGKFYTGEGHKFSPLGSQTEYIYLSK